MAIHILPIVRTALAWEQFKELDSHLASQQMQVLKMSSLLQAAADNRDAQQQIAAFEKSIQAMKNKLATLVENCKDIPELQKPIATYQENAKTFVLAWETLRANFEQR